MKSELKFGAGEGFEVDAGEVIFRQCVELLFFHGDQRSAGYEELEILDPPKRKSFRQSAVVLFGSAEHFTRDELVFCLSCL